jgi:hypothetical protein
MQRIAIMVPSITDSLSNELKAYAVEYARSDRPLPLDDECDDWLRTLLRREQIFLPPDAFDFYSAELCNMVAEYRQKGLSVNATQSAVTPGEGAVETTTLKNS